MESMMVFDGFDGSSLFQPSNLQMATTDLGPVPYKGLNGSAEILFIIEIFLRTFSINRIDSEKLLFVFIQRHKSSDSFFFLY